MLEIMIARDKNQFLDSLRVASPCSASWETMNGDDRVRFCELCNLHVYNIAQLTRNEAASLFANTKGRICARLYRRTDGTIITKDCPVGLRAIRRRVATLTGAIFATVLSLGATAFGQRQSANQTSCKQQPTVTTRVPASADEVGTLSGIICNQSDAVIAGARVTITDRKLKQTMVTVSNDEGRFRVAGLAPGVYDILVEAPASQKLNLTDVKLGAMEALDLSFVLNDGQVLMGVVGNGEPIGIPAPDSTNILQDILMRSKKRTN